MCDWRLCPLANHGSQKMGKGKYGQYWPSLVEKLDTPIGSQNSWNSGRGLLNSRWAEAYSLALSASWALAMPSIDGSACGTSRCWAHLGLRPRTVGSQLPGGRVPCWMRASLGFSLWDAMTQCSMAHGSWTAASFLL